MSAIGTSVAAGVAQTTHNAQRTAREGDAKARQRADSERTDQLAFLAHLSSAGETRDADDEMPDKPPPSYEKLWQGDGEKDEDDESPADDRPAPDPAQLHLYDPHHPPQPTPLYRHLDIQA
jgi:hypothetical protein